MFEFCDKLKAVREQLKLSQQALAKELDVAFVTINRLENGKFSPSYDTLKRFEELYRKHNIKI